MMRDLAKIFVFVRASWYNVDKAARILRKSPHKYNR